MSNENSSPPDAASEDEIIAWLHEDAARAYSALRERSLYVAGRVQQVGRARALSDRVALKRLHEVTAKLGNWQFSDMD